MVELHPESDIDAPTLQKAVRLLGFAAEIQPFVSKYSVSGHDRQQSFLVKLAESDAVLTNPRLAKRSIDDLADGSQTVALYSRFEDWPDTGVAAYCDGHVKRSPYPSMLNQLAMNPFMSPKPHHK